MYKFGTIKKMLFLIYFIIGSLILVDLNITSQFVGMCSTFHAHQPWPIQNIGFSASLGGGGGGGVEAGV